MSENKPRVKIFFVTYDEIDLLNETLDSFFKTGGGDFCDSVNVINNHSNFKLNDEFVDRVNVIHNNTRPDFSTGHLARNWNQAIIHGFKDIDNPDCDILITSQTDVLFFDGWTDKIKEIHIDMGISFYTSGGGDCFCSYTIDAIKRVGIWDERFCGLGYQEADYFARAVYHLQTKCVISDFQHGRTYNLIQFNHNTPFPPAYDYIEGWHNSVCITSRIAKIKNRNDFTMSDHHIKSMSIGHDSSLAVFNAKFTINYSSINSILNCIDSGKSIYSGNLKTSILYPYFENKIPNRHTLNYMN